jgi:GT2 family glycosyltransferase
MKITAVIVTFNGQKWINKCFSSITNSIIPLDVIVIDNNSTDNTVKLIKKNYPCIQIIESKINLGFGKANNIGISKGYENGSDYFFLLNQDAWIESDTIEKLVKYAMKNNKFGIISPIHLNGSGNALDKEFLKYITRRNSENLISDIYLKKTENKIYKSEFINAASWLVSRQCIETVGGFSPTFFHYGEDINYCQRVLYHQLNIGIVTDSIIFHDRENRNIENYSSNFNFNFTQDIIIKLSNPLSNIKAKNIQLDLYKSILKTILKFNIKDMNLNIKKSKLLNKIDVNQLEKNKIYSQTIGLNFLN